ncbi:UDP-N-acetylmuramoyl-L-alanine--D-glutamate ligase [Azospira restricta]|uniref:UDP-N-acetylmuramoylalanine--D-glutamate ligase n=1 Tax=Azospira restricta TaxID=404405 RepID=A0A974SNV6_9RHOO|nr:UDP-N-acetylmuramoyl-L-alanine--D-glutamate ligase [Azospira restricta]QRJ63731.1 UDP-N-acetylmuramoyl-L-alanine--D-glutamate ligase [Azospira restricta]
MDVKGKQALVLGLGETGLAMAKWLAREGARVRVADSRAAPPNAAELRAAVPAAELVAGPFAAATFAGVDLIAISPGLPVQEANVQAAIAAGVPVVSEIELFAWAVHARTPQARIVAITGSNGKTTTTALAAHLANAAGVPAVACGNISPAALDALMAALDGNALPALWVLELSSFQLETTHSLDADAATVLNICEDHLDRYAGLDDYAAAKARIFKGCRVMVLNRDDDRSLGMGRCGKALVSFGLDRPPRAADYGLADGWLMRGSERLLPVAEMKLAGLHNAANALAALALLEGVGIAPQRVLAALREFRGLAHRVEFVTRVNGVDYYDDSKGTNVGATLAAIQGMGRKLAIILGGDGKGQDFAPLAAALAAHGRAVALIGRDAPAIEAAIAGCGLPLQRCADMDAAVAFCAAQAQPGDAVLLSPACASLDMYRNYAHRAEAFIAAVKAREGAAC